MKKYYQITEITKDEADSIKEFQHVYEKASKYYTLSWGHDISTLAEDGVTILHNTEIEGVIAAEDDDDAAKQFGLTRYE